MELRDLLVPYGIHLLYFIGVVYLVGFCVFLLNRLFYKLLGGGRFVCYATGLIGTPIHELSHALMCLFFGHRIVEMRLFRVDGKSGTLGYVTHSYRKSNLYHVMGNYFIGTAPILVGTAFLCLMMRLLLPETFVTFRDYLEDFVSWQQMGYVPEQLLGVGAVFVSFLTALASAAGTWQFWAFFALTMCVSIHMNLSGADIVGSLGALPIIGILLAVSVFLISNTVMIGIQVRKEEINIMKYIGATDRFIRIPFVLEGLIIGFSIRLLFSLS